MEKKEFIEQVSFEEYSTEYDRLLQYSPPYQQLVDTVIKKIKQRFSNQASINVLDIGGGTGNFSKRILKEFPNAQIDFVEPSLDMLTVAKEKLRGEQVVFHQEPFQQIPTY